MCSLPPRSHPVFILSDLLLFSLELRSDLSRDDDARLLSAVWRLPRALSIFIDCGFPSAQRSVPTILAPKLISLHVRNALPTADIAASVYAAWKQAPRLCKLKLTCAIPEQYPVQVHDSIFTQFQQLMRTGHGAQLDRLE